MRMNILTKGRKYFPRNEIKIKCQMMWEPQKVCRLSFSGGETFGIYSKQIAQIISRQILHKSISNYLLSWDLFCKCFLSRHDPLLHNKRHTRKLIVKWIKAVNVCAIEWLKKSSKAQAFKHRRRVLVLCQFMFCSHVKHNTQTVHDTLKIVICNLQIVYILIQL